ncbi:MAG: DUF4214 domain-containing protein [Oscillospiraceae bacterium]|nr:DUF4214 domain-containing protein [Oscillospiraceae bacterium]
MKIKNLLSKTLAWALCFAMLLTFAPAIWLARAEEDALGDIRGEFESYTQGLFDNGEITALPHEGELDAVFRLLSSAVDDNGWEIYNSEYAFASEGITGPMLIIWFENNQDDTLSIQFLWSEDMLFLIQAIAIDEDDNTIDPGLNFGELRDIIRTNGGFFAANFIDLIPAEEKGYFDAFTQKLKANGDISYIDSSEIDAVFDLFQQAVDKGWFLRVCVFEYNNVTNELSILGMLDDGSVPFSVYFLWQDKNDGNLMLIGIEALENGTVPILDWDNLGKILNTNYKIDDSAYISLFKNVLCNICGKKLTPCECWDLSYYLGELHRLTNNYLLVPESFNITSFMEALEDIAETLMLIDSEKYADLTFADGFEEQYFDALLSLIKEGCLDNDELCEPDECVLCAGILMADMQEELDNDKIYLVKSEYAYLLWDCVVDRIVEAIAEVNASIINLDDYSDAASIQTAIAAALAASDGGMVTVIGEFTEADTALNINIPADKKVTWAAEYTGTTSVQNNGLISLTGAGEMEVTTGAVIKAVPQGATAPGNAIRVGENVTLTVNGGTIESANHAIYAIGCAEVNVNGGSIAVRADGGYTDGSAYAIAMLIDAVLSVNGGTITNYYSPSLVIRTTHNAVAYITGGTIADGGIRRAVSDSLLENYSLAYYTESYADKFDITGSTSKFTPGENLFCLDAPVWTSGGMEYTYSGVTPAAAPVVAAFPTGLAIDELTVNWSDDYYLVEGSTVTFWGGFDNSGVVISIKGSLADGRILVDFSTTAQSVNVSALTPATVTFDTTPADITYGETINAPSASAVDKNGDTAPGTITLSYTGILADGKSTAYSAGVPTETAPTDPGTYTVTATLDSATHSGSASAEFTIEKKQLLGWSQGWVYDKTYDGTTSAKILDEDEFLPRFFIEPFMIGDDMKDVWGTVAFANANAGEHAVTATGFGITGSDAWKYIAPTEQPIFANGTITKAPLTISNATIGTKTYNGDKTASITDVTFGGLQNGEELTIGTDYTVTGTYDNANAGTGNRTVTATITLEDTEIANNYTLADGSLSMISQSINKAKPPETAISHTISFIENLEKSVNIPLFPLIPALETPAEYGIITYTVGTPTGDSFIILTLRTGEPIPSIDVAVRDDVSSGLSVTIPVTVTSANYEDFTINITVNTVDKYPATVSFTSAPGNTVYGTAPGAPIASAVSDVADEPVGEHSFIYRYSGTLADGDSTPYPLTETVPTAPGTYTVTATLESDTHAGEATSAAFTIEKKIVTVKADDKTVTRGADLPLPEATVSYTGFIGTDNESNALDTQATAEHTAVDTDTAGTFDIKITTFAVLNSEVAANYVLDHKDGTLTVRVPASPPPPSDAEQTTPEAPTPGNTPTPETETDFVEFLYLNAFGREPDAGGFDHWMERLESGELTGVDIMFAFVFSEEAKNLELDDEGFVTMLYRTFFGRMPDEGGFAHWLSRLNAGESREAIFAGFANSVEFDNLCKAAGIETGSFIQKRSETSASFIAMAAHTPIPQRA